MRCNAQIGCQRFMQGAVRSSEEMEWSLLSPGETNSCVRGARYKLRSRHNDEEGTVWYTMRVSALKEFRVRGG